MRSLSFSKQLWLCAAATLTLGLLSSLDAAKPGPTQPPPVPAGTIYFDSGLGFSAMKGDGSAKTVVLPAGVSAIPSDRYYGADPVQDRWYLAILETGTYDEVIRTDGSSLFDVAHFDAFAFRTNPGNRSQLEWVQLTDLYGVFRPIEWIEWSNDSNHSDTTSYIAMYGRKLDGIFSVVENGPGTADDHTILDLRNNGGGLNGTYEWGLRLPLTATDIDAGWLAGNFAPFRPELPEQLDVCLRAVSGGVGTASPSGDHYVTSEDRLLVIRSTLDRSLVRVLWDGEAGVEPSYPMNAVWSRDGNTISFVNGTNATYTANGGVWSVPAAGGAAPSQLAKNVVKGFKITRITPAGWSPDSQFQFLRSITEDPSKPTITDLLRIPAAGGTATNLTADFDLGTGGGRWVSNVPGR